MLIGIGNDLLAIHRMKATYERTDGRIAHRILGPEELVVFESRLARNSSRGMAYLSTRFAAKEAIVKALGTGFAHGMWIRDCGVVQNDWGRPDVVWSLRGLQVKNRLGVGSGHVTLTDEGGLVVAVAVLEKMH